MQFTVSASTSLFSKVREGEAALGRHLRKEISIVEGDIEDISLKWVFPFLPKFQLLCPYGTPQHNTKQSQATDTYDYPPPLL